jgi:dipeptidyl aminopeptidase/acylaminoacyl peptidase
MKLGRSLSTLSAATLLLFAAGSLHAARKPFNGKIAFESNRDGNNEIYVMNPDGSQQTRLTNNPASDGQPAWSPDGKKIAFTRTSDIFVMNADGTGQVPLTANGHSGFPAWSPDGTRIAFESGDGSAISVMNADGSNQTLLTQSAARNLEPSWSADGLRLVFVSDRDGNFELYTMNSDGSEVTRLTFNDVLDQLPHFSPDGKTIVFSQFSPVTHQSRAVIMEANGANAEPVTESNMFQTAFSPDGRSFVFMDGNEIQTIGADGSQIAQLTNNSSLDILPSWQPVIAPDTIGVYRPTTGQWLLRNANSAGSPDITVVFGGLPGDLPVTGDWNGDGRTDIGVFRDGVFQLAVWSRGDTLQVFDHFRFGQAGDRPVAGDWDGDGLEEVGVYRDGVNREPSTFLLRVRRIDGTFETFLHPFGTAGDRPLAGDWNGDGVDTIGVFHAGVFLLTDSFAEAEHSTSFGRAGDLPIAGAWRAGLRDGVGVFHPSTTDITLESQLAAGVDFKFIFGTGGDIPVAGHWTLP